MFSIDGITLLVAPIAAVLTLMYTLHKRSGGDEN